MTPKFDCGDQWEYLPIGNCNYISGTKGALISHMIVIGSFIVLLVQNVSIFTDDRAPALVRFLGVNSKLSDFA